MWQGDNRRFNGAFSGVRQGSVIYWAGHIQGISSKMILYLQLSGLTCGRSVSWNSVRWRQAWRQSYRTLASHPALSRENCTLRIKGVRRITSQKYVSPIQFFFFSFVHSCIFCLSSFLSCSSFAKLIFSDGGRGRGGYLSGQGKRRI